MTVDEIMELATSLGDMRYLAGRGKATKEEVQEEYDIFKAAIEELAKDAERLEWAMNNMSQHNYTLFGMHVMNIGGTGDVSDCRSFVDARIKEAP